VREHRFRVTAEEAGERLDSVVAARLPISRTHAARLAADGAVSVDGVGERKSARVEEGQEVVVRVPAPEPASAEAEDIPLDIVYEDSDLLVIHKPAGLVVHPAPGHPGGTLVNALLHRCGDLAGIGGVLRPGIVHRLDKDTSGLLVVAKNEAAQASLAGQIKRREVRKLYLALVRGRVEPPEGVIDAPIGRHPRRRQRMAVVEGRREAQTRYRVREFLDDDGVAYSLVEAEPLTGRTHQIRVHFASIGRPVVGDRLYGKASPLVGRQFLHAWRLGFRLPASGRYQEFESPLPGDLAEALRVFPPRTP